MVWLKTLSHFEPFIQLSIELCSMPFLRIFILIVSRKFRKLMRMFHVLEQVTHFKSIALMSFSFIFPSSRSVAILLCMCRCWSARHAVYRRWLIRFVGALLILLLWEHFFVLSISLCSSFSLVLLHSHFKQFPISHFRQFSVSTRLFVMQLRAKINFDPCSRYLTMATFALLLLVPVVRIDIYFALCG